MTYNKIYSRDVIYSDIKKWDNLESIKKEYNLPVTMDLFDTAEYISLSNMIDSKPRDEYLLDYRHKIIAKYVSSGGC